MLSGRVFILMMSAVKIQCPHAKALPFHGAIWVQTSAFMPWCVTISLKEEMIARQRARPPYTARYPCTSSYTFWRWELGILHPRNPCLLHTEASVFSTLALVQPSLQKTPCSWQNSWHNGCYPTSVLLRLGEGRKNKAVSHILIITLTS